jgi:hypothetical protein
MHKRGKNRMLDKIFFKLYDTKGRNMATDNNNKNRSHSSSGAMGPEEAGHLGGTAPRRHGMSREEAGHLGGTAPHKCRGFECQEQGHKDRGRENE